MAHFMAVKLTMLLCAVCGIAASCYEQQSNSVKIVRDWGGGGSQSKISQSDNSHHTLTSSFILFTNPSIYWINNAEKTNRIKWDWTANLIININYQINSKTLLLFISKKHH